MTKDNLLETNLGIVYAPLFCQIEKRNRVNFIFNLRKNNNIMRTSAKSSGHKNLNCTSVVEHSGTECCPEDTDIISSFGC